MCLRPSPVSDQNINDNIKEIARLAGLDENYKAAYGKLVLIRLSERLSSRFGGGRSLETLKKCRLFYSVYNRPQIGSTVLTKSPFKAPAPNLVNSVDQIQNTPATPHKFVLSWSHYLVLMRIEDENARSFYEIECAKQNWSVRCRTGKVMKYDRSTGHRIKDEAMKGRITWIHSLMKWSGALPRDWQLTQCLFGEHLLPEYPKKAVALVESEKTAVICAALMPQYVWLATGGKSQFNDRLNVLASRDVIAFPDIDGYAAWCEKAKSFTGLNITVSGILQQNATVEDFAAHIDIADWLIRWKQHPESFQKPEWNATCAKVLPLISPEYRDNVKQLIEKLELVVIE